MEGPRRPLTVFLLRHDRVADGQQAPELLHHPVLPVQHSAHELQVSEKQFPVGEFVPDVGVLLGAGEAGSGRVPARPLPPSSAVGRPALTLRGTSSSSWPGERCCFRLSSPGPLGVPRPPRPNVTPPGATGKSQAQTRCPGQRRTLASALLFAQRRETWGHVSRGTSEGRPRVGLSPLCSISFVVFLKMWTWPPNLKNLVISHKHKHFTYPTPPRRPTVPITHPPDPG